MTTCLDLSDDGAFERFEKKYNKVLIDQDENFDLGKIIEEFKEEEDELLHAKRHMV